MDLREQVLVTPAVLAELLSSPRSVTVLAVRSPDSVAPAPYEAAPRIPGAIETDMTEDFASLTDPVEGSRPLPSADALQATVTRLGIGEEALVVVYDHDGGLIAARAWWVLRWAGIEARLLDGGFQAWEDAGLDVATQPPEAPVPGTMRIETGQLPTFGPDEAIPLGREGVLLDSRIAVNYEGGPSEAGAPRRGHIPGAVNVPAPANLGAGGRFLGEADLRALYGPTGALDGDPVGIYCGAGVSAAHDLAALATLGVNASLYPGSWSAWISDPRRPAAIGPERG